MAKNSGHITDRHIWFSGLMIGIVLSLLIYFLALVRLANAQTGDQTIYWWPPNIAEHSGVVTDSIRWVTVKVDSTNLGKSDCDHHWEYSKEWRKGGASQCLALHGGFHCDWDNNIRDRICKLCLRHEIQEEIWYQNGIPLKKTAFDSLKDKLK